MDDCGFKHFVMLHFVDQGWDRLHQPQNLGLLTLTVHIKHEVASGFDRNIVANGANPEINSLQLSVSCHLDAARVLSKKFHNFPLVSSVAFFVE